MIKRRIKSFLMRLNSAFISTKHWFQDYWHTYNILLWRVWSFECCWNVSNTFNPFIVYAYGLFKSELRSFKSRDCHCWMSILCRWLTSSYCWKLYLCPSLNLFAEATSYAAKIFGFLADFSQWYWFWLEQSIDNILWAIHVFSNVFLQQYGPTKETTDLSHPSFLLRLRYPLWLN